MADVAVGKRAQVVIPAEVRRRLGIKVGDRLHLQVDKLGRIVLERIAEDPLERLRTVSTKLFRGTDPVAYQRGLRYEGER